MLKFDLVVTDQVQPNEQEITNPKTVTDNSVILNSVSYKDGSLFISNKNYVPWETK